MTEKNKEVIAVLGAGTWGLTLGMVLAGKKTGVRFWDPSKEYVEILNRDRENKKGLPGVKIPEDILITADMAEVLEGVDGILLVSPSHFVRSVSQQMATIPGHPGFVVVASKGIEKDTLKRMSEIIYDEYARKRQVPVAVLSGPSHAEEVSMKIPTAVTCAAKDHEIARRVQELFITDAFRVYTNHDLIGIELGAALKNVIALAAGICDGLGLGDNTKAALMTRGLAEMTRLGVRLGGQKDTFAGLAGMGDLITTCASQHSRNRFVGEQLGKGRSLKDILGDMVEVAEGVRTTVSAYQLQKKLDVDMPITQEIYRVLYEDKDPRAAVSDLMNRAATSEY